MVDLYPGTNIEKISADDGILNGKRWDQKLNAVLNILGLNTASKVVAHFRADDLINIADNSPVRLWEDRSGFGGDLLVGAGTPVVKTNGLNDKPTVRVPTGAYLVSRKFANAGLAGGSAWGQEATLPQPFTFACVVKVDSSGIGANPRFIMGSSNPRLLQQSGNGFIEISSGTSNTIGANGGPRLDDDQFHVVIGHFGTSEGWVMIDGVLTGTAATDSHNSNGVLSTASAVGATSISTSISFAAGTRLVIDTGNAQETVTTTGAPSGSGPYSIPVPALAYAHNSGVRVVARTSLSQLSLGAQADSGNNMLGGEFAEAMVLTGRISKAAARDLSVALAKKWGLRSDAPAQLNVSWIDTSDSTGQALRVFMPPARLLGSSCKVVVVNHQQNGTQAITPDFFAYTFCHALATAGYVVVASNNHGINSWSGNDALTDVTNAVEWVAANIGPVTDTMTIGYSMGACLSAVAAKQNRLPNLRGVYLIDGAVNLGWMYSHNYAGSINTGLSATAGTLSTASSAGASSISSTVSFPAGTSILIDPTGTNPETVTTTGAPTGSGPYTIPVPALTYAHNSGVMVSDYPTVSLGRDPALFTPASLPQGIRWRAISSTADNTVVKASNTDVFMPIAAAAGALEAGSITHPDGHIAKGASIPFDVLDFAKRCLGPSGAAS